MIAGFNAFDVGFIKDWFREIGLYDSYKDLFHYKNLDVFPLVITLKHLGFIDTENDKLKTVCEHFNIQIDAHNAQSDIEATKNLYELISDRFINDKEVYKENLITGLNVKMLYLLQDLKLMPCLIGLQNLKK